MKKIEDWYGVNKSTPDQWFTRWEQFLVPLMLELNYQCVSRDPIQKPRGKHWTKEIKFKHPQLSPLTLFLSRKRKQEGGQIHFIYGFAYEQFIDTIGSSPGGYSIMSRQQVGEHILNYVREGWVKSKDVNQES